MDENEENQNVDAGDELGDDYSEETLPSKTYKVKNGRILATIDDYEAMVQAIDKIMQTERFVYPIYDENYGHDLNDLISKDFEYIQVEAERMIEEALKADDRVEDVTVDSVEKTSQDSILISATVDTIFGQINIEKGVDSN
ncbi:DUF2634 domain-containing protein [Apilactobacillus timberlakei]|uniref:DUF2634 domain-containing protein n=1 Tax=Apilactobacillus timberlakei TaxID=2008380 RepID=A0ABY2YRL5_9LACO|nr:DUF2634 domain-containing protein [Apilactobacillus timberlakei]TPR12404.1 DUF2634 domain-containing protein [Apilactobacillus timberlakei]TPR12990.1 DUF2634 domain-containing protein [Apilactobacillus timberlakei]